MNLKDAQIPALWSVALVASGWSAYEVLATKSHVARTFEPVKQQLNVIESQGIERQLTNIARHRCDPTNANRYDGVWNDLRHRFEARRGRPYQFPDCAQ